jgi:Na+/proline symporter
LLGVFLLGLLTRRAKQNGAIVGMLFGLVLNIYIWKWTHIAWTWYVTIGATMTFCVGYIASLATPASESAEGAAQDANR